MAKKCRCPICGSNNADSNHARRSYLRAKITRDERGLDADGLSKKQTRKLRRLREKREWKNNSEES